MDGKDLKQSLSIGTFNEESVFHLYHTARLFYPDWDIKVSVQAITPDICLGETAAGLYVTDGTSRLDSPGRDKESIKRLLYRFLASTTGKTIPWGTLIGVRPTKIASRMLAEGRSEGEIRDFYRETYLTSDGKIDLALDVAKREERILRGEKENVCGIYIDMPFCPTRCFYCSFLSLPSSQTALMAEYLAALEKDIIATGRMIKEFDLHPAYIYFGGGTPTSPDDLPFEKIMGLIDEYFVKDHDISEFTVECGRPDTMNETKFASMKVHGCGRISINPQSFCDRTLEAMGRTHSGEDIIRAYRAARSAGFGCINMDVILGLPSETEAEVAMTMEEIIHLDPENVTIHGLAVKRGSVIKESGRFHLPDEATVQRMFEVAYQKLYGAGYKPYYLYRQKNISANLENIGFSKPGWEGYYNMAMMEETISIIACGASGMSKQITVENGQRKIRRYSSYKDVRRYIDNLDQIIHDKRQMMEAIAFPTKEFK